MTNQKQLSEAEKAALIGGDADPKPTQGPRKLTPQQEVTLGMQAKDILNSEAFKLAVEKVEHAMFEEWKRSAPQESEGRERLYVHVHVLRSLTAALNEILGAGMVANQKLSAATVQRAKGRSV